MDKLNLDKLSAKMQELNLSEEDVISVLGDLVTNKGVLKSTPLYVVYKKGDTFFAKKGLILPWKKYVWGIATEEGLCVSRLPAKDMLAQEAALAKEVKENSPKREARNYQKGLLFADKAAEKSPKQEEPLTEDEGIYKMLAKIVDTYNPIPIIMDDGRKCRLVMHTSSVFAICVRGIDESFDKTAKILQSFGVDCMLWRDDRFTSVAFQGANNSVEMVDASRSFFGSEGLSLGCFKLKDTERGVRVECYPSNAYYPARVLFMITML